MNSDALEIIEILENKGHQTRMAGGCIRDRLLKIEPKDIDLATIALPEQVIEIFESLKYHVIPTGLQHGTITVVGTNKTPIEITTLRIDTNHTGRHAEVEFTDDWKLDASRRDFTINAMFMDKDEKIYDYFGGKKDLEAGVVRFVGNAEERIKEDYLRIMRYFRFYAKMGSNIVHNEAIEAIEKHKDGLKEISQERITSELLKMLDYENYMVGISLLHKTGIGEIVLPEADPANFSMNFSYEDHTDSRIIRLAGILTGKFTQLSTSAEEIGKRLKLPTKDIKKLALLTYDLALLKEPADSLDLIDKFEENFQHYNDILLYYRTKMHVGNLLQHYTEYADLRVTTLPSAKDLMFLHNIKEGRFLGDLLKLLKRSWRNNKISPGRNPNKNPKYEDLIEIVLSPEEDLANYLLDSNITIRTFAKLGVNYVGQRKKDGS